MTRISLSLACLVGFVGCTEAPPAIYPTSGTVTYQGEPVEGATVVFLPVEADGQPATGRTDSLGNFRLGTNESSDGARAGEFKVKITKIVSPPSPLGPYDEGFEEWAAEQEEARKRGETTGLEPYTVLPEAYAQTETSGLTATIEAKEENQISFDLEGEVTLPSGVAAEEGSASEPEN